MRISYQLILALLPTLVGCQTPDDANYVRHERSTPEVDWPLYGIWHNEIWLDIDEDSVSCDGEETGLVEVQQKTFQMAANLALCNFDPVVFWVSYPPYTELNLLTNGTRSAYFR